MEERFPRRKTPFGIQSLRELQALTVNCALCVRTGGRDMARVVTEGGYKKVDFEISEYPRLLFVDDEEFIPQTYINALKDRRFEVFNVKTSDAALRVARRRVFDVVVVDVMMSHGRHFGPLETQGGYRTGIALAREMVNHQPSAVVAGLTNSDDADVEAWFTVHPGHYYFHKQRVPPDKFAAALRDIVLGVGFMPQIFIVHGHDTEAAISLKNYLQNTLGYPEPVILAERPSKGMTLIEKFEAYAQDADVVFALFTPDDFADKGTGRARQNVVFEFGYFLGVLGRRSGRVFLLHKGSAEIPSDLNGIIYIDISRGIEASGEEIRRELRAVASALGPTASNANPRRR
jgi:DNA-binding NarL/FixJ family response regulator